MSALQVGVWFTYGCAALSCEEFSLAATAFRRCVNLDNDVCINWSAFHWIETSVHSVVCQRLSEVYCGRDKAELVQCTLKAVLVAWMKFGKSAVLSGWISSSVGFHRQLQLLTNSSYSFTSRGGHNISTETDAGLWTQQQPVSYSHYCCVFHRCLDGTIKTIFGCRYVLQNSVQIYLCAFYVRPVYCILQ